MSTKPDPLIAFIVGSGASGISFAHFLRTRCGVKDDEMMVCERAESHAGTWWNNQYPGVAVDIPIFLYSLSYKPKYDWRQNYATGAENLAYLQEVVRDLNIAPLIKYKTEVTSATWDEKESVWVIETRKTPPFPRPGEESSDVTEDVQTYRARFLLLGTGVLSLPKMPTDIPGLKDFKGPSCHSANYNLGDLTGKRVALIGTGATGTQIIIDTAPKAKSLVIFQSAPSWVVPKYNQILPEWQKTAMKYVPGYALYLRWSLFWAIESRGLVSRLKGSEMNKKWTEDSEKWLREQLKDRPDLIPKTLPTYPVGCHRIIPQDHYFTTLKRDNVTLSDSRPARVTETGIVDRDGVEHQVDVIIASTGFHVHKYLNGLRIYGPGGRDLQKEWANERADCWNGMMVAGMPNLFISQGPRAFLGTQSAFFSIECQVDYVTQVLARALLLGYKTVEVNPEAQKKFIEWFDSEMSKMIWTDTSVGCGSYYKNSFGESTVFYPDDAWRFWWRTAWPNWSRDLIYTTGSPKRMTPRHARGIRNVALGVLGVVALKNREAIWEAVSPVVDNVRKFVGW